MHRFCNPVNSGQYVVEAPTGEYYGTNDIDRFLGNREHEVRYPR